MFDDFGGRIPSDKPPIKTPGELAIERGEEWPKPVPEPAFKAAIAQASADAGRSVGTERLEWCWHQRKSANGPTQPDYGAPAGWHAPGWPPQPPPGQYRTGQVVPAAAAASGWQPRMSPPGRLDALSAVSALSIPRPAAAARRPDRMRPLPTTTTRARNRTGLIRRPTADTNGGFE